MKHILFLCLFLFVTISCDAQTAEELAEQNKNLDTNKVIQPELSHPKVSQVISRILERYHFNKVVLNDSISSLILDNYIKILDNNKLYFLQSDINQFEKYRYNFDDYLYDGNLEPIYEIFNVYKQHMNSRIPKILKLLENEFDFSIDESFTPDRSEAKWASSESELDELWRKRVKNDALNRKLENKTWEEISDALSKRYKNFHKSILQYNSEDVFQLSMNAFTEVIDPHTSYFSPRTSDNFKINMSLSLEGIGAQLLTENEYTKVARIISGGPADKNGRLKEDDFIIGVAQGDDGEMVDVVGWRIDDVVSLIRGEKGSIVRLSVIKHDAAPDQPPVEIKIVRDKVKIEEQAAKKEVIDIEEQTTLFRLGVIEIPTFYIDFEGKNRGETDYKSTTRDVTRIIKELKEEDIDGIIIDLRNNGGGSLQEAVELTGLFIESGPVVQVKSTNGYIDVEKDPDESIVYNGPLAVIVNRYSASASEIFSAAIQDYGRGVVVGEQTFGKGTVQNLIDLNKFIPSRTEKRGEVKLTIAKYYRISGGSTQNLGVVPDIAFPSAIDPEEFGESSRPSALPWDQIPATPYKKYQDLSDIIKILKKDHEERIAKNVEFQYLEEDIGEYRENKAKKSFSLNIDIRKAEREKSEAKRKKRDEQRQQNSDLDLVEMEEVSAPNIELDDPLLEETGHILADLILKSIG